MGFKRQKAYLRYKALDQCLTLVLMDLTKNSINHFILKLPFWKQATNLTVWQEWGKAIYLTKYQIMIICKVLNLIFIPKQCRVLANHNVRTSYDRSSLFGTISYKKSMIKTLPLKTEITQQEAKCSTILHNSKRLKSIIWENMRCLRKIKSKLTKLKCRKKYNVILMMNFANEALTNWESKKLQKYIFKVWIWRRFYSNRRNRKLSKNYIKRLRIGKNMKLKRDWMKWEIKGWGPNLEYNTWKLTKRLGRVAQIKNTLKKIVQWITIRILTMHLIETRRCIQTSLQERCQN